jgi:hypothetical protein
VLAFVGASPYYYAGAAVSAGANSTIAGGIGVIGNCDNATGKGIWGQTAGASGYGIYAINNSASVAGAPFFAGHASAATGSGFTVGTARAAIKAQGAVAGSYGFGVLGSGGSSTRSGGILGDDYNTARGALGYYSAGAVDYGVYAFGNYNLGAIGGRVAAGENQPIVMDANASVGLGAFGGVMGGWIKGLAYGFNASGEKYGAYVHGKTLTNDVIATLNETAGSSDRVATYAPTAMKVEISDKGVAKLVNGRLTVSFSRQFSELLSSTQPVIITVSPLGNSNGLYIENSSNNGFTVVENNSGASNVSFNWIAIGVKKGFENPSISPEILNKDFEVKMNGPHGVMYNDSNPENPDYSIWWDGSNVRFDKPATGINRESMTVPALEAATVPDIPKEKTIKTSMETAVKKDTNKTTEQKNNNQ